jgi:serine/threonine protein kinase
MQNGQPLQNGQRLGKYQILELLKTGGMASVYRARDLDTGRVVAIKVLSQILAMDPGYVARFKNEADQVRKLAHPNIVPIEYFGVEIPYTYFVMPLFKGSLRDALKRYKRLAPESALDITIQIASALTAVHGLGLIHRDIKPDNILLSADRALLTDFGIVRQVQFTGAGEPPTLAGSGLPIGTPQYMAPEQLASQRVDQRADLYALGAVLYEMLTGQAPHGGDSPYTIASRVLTDPIVPPSRHSPAIPPELNAVVMRALARNPAERFVNAANMRAALQGVYETLRRDKTTSRARPSEHETKPAPPPSPPPAPPPSPYLPLQNFAPSVHGVDNLPPLSAVAPPPAVAPSIQPSVNAGTRSDGDRGDGQRNRPEPAEGNEPNTRPARDGDGHKNRQPLLVVGLAAVLILIALFTGLNVAMNFLTHVGDQATATAVGQPPPTRPPPPPGGPPVRVSPQAVSYPCNGSVDTTLTLINDGRDPFPWSAALVGPNSAGVKLDVSNGMLAPGTTAQVRVTGRPSGNSFDVNFTTAGGNPIVQFTCN